MTKPRTRSPAKKADHTRFLTHGLIFTILIVLPILAQHVAGQPLVVAIKQVVVPLPPGASVETEPQQPSGAPVPRPSTPAPTAGPVGLEEYVAGLEGRFGVAAQLLPSGQSISINADRVFKAASLYKLLVMHRVYDQVEQGKLKLTTSLQVRKDDLVEAIESDKLSPGDALTVGDALERMVTVSSNPAAYVLARATGGWEAQVATASSLGLKSIRWEGNELVSTPSDLLRFFVLLANRSPVSPKASDEMLALLSRQKVNDRIPAGLPKGTRVAHKTGELGDIRNDAGIVFAPSGSYAVVLMANEVNPAKAVQAEVQLSRMIFDRFSN